MMTSFHFCTLFKIRKKKKKKIILSKQVNKYNICNISLSKKKKKNFTRFVYFVQKHEAKKKEAIQPEKLFIVFLILVLFCTLMPVFVRDVLRLLSHRVSVCLFCGGSHSDMKCTRVKMPITTALLSSRLETESVRRTGSTDTSPSPEMQSHNLQ